MALSYNKLFVLMKEKGITTYVIRKENIISQRKFIVNITHDPEIFMLSTLGNLSEDYFNEDNSLKCAEAYFKCEVINLS